MNLKDPSAILQRSSNGFHVDRFGHLCIRGCFLRAGLFQGAVRLLRWRTGGKRWWNEGRMGHLVLEVSLSVLDVHSWRGVKAKPVTPNEPTHCNSCNWGQSWHRLESQQNFLRFTSRELPFKERLLNEYKYIYIYIIVHYFSSKEILLSLYSANCFWLLLVCKKSMLDTLT